MVDGPVKPLWFRHGDNRD